MRALWLLITFLYATEVCGCPEDDVYPDLADCTKYYVCRDGVENSQSCSSGEVFDASLMSCSNSSNCYVEKDGEVVPEVIDQDSGDALQYQLTLEQQVLKATQRPDYDTTAAPSSTNPNWMSEVPNGTPITALSLPGTHNTMSFFGGPWAECQTWSLFDQYKAGIRFADIRTRHFNNALPIHHGIMFQKTGFENVLKETVRFLDYHPTETILMRVREEYKSENNNDNFPSIINKYMTTYLPSHRRWDETYLPTLGEARGRVVLLRDFYDYRWIHFRTFSVDDKWDVASLFHVGQKWDSVWKHLETAQNGNPNYGFVTFMSGSSALALPSSVATRMNSRLWEIIKNKTGKTRWGIVAMDFPGVGLIQALIRSNFD